MRRDLGFLCPLFCVALLIGCPTGDDDDDDSAVGDDDDDDTPVDLSALTFGDFDGWAEPLEDYIDALTAEYGGNGFHHSVWDLAVYEDRMYFGYGDADINSGRIFPTELRYFSDPDEPDGWASEFAVDEEMVEQYRQFEGDDGLYIAGLDATEDDLMGNAYNRHPDTDWVKSRTLEHALHVHDAAVWDGVLYASGSGCTWEEYDAFTISSMFWTSTDGGESYGVVEKMIHPSVGDARWTRLLPLADELYLFGHRTDGQYINELIPHVYDGTDLTAMPDLDNRWVWETWPVDGNRGLVSAVKFGFGTTTHVAYLLEAGGSVDDLDELEDETLVDAFEVAPGQWLLLARDGIGYGDEPGADHRILFTTDFDDYHELTTFEADDAWPTSVGYYGGHLFLGLDDGEIWRAEVDG